MIPAGVVVEARQYARPFATPLRTARGEWRLREGWIVRLGDPSTGAEGFGEVAPVDGFATEALPAAAAFLRGLAARPATAPREVPGNLPATRFALGQALEGLRRGNFGGEAGVAGPPVPVAALLPAGPAALEAAPKRAAEGYRAFKWKIATAPAAGELALLARLAALLPSGARLRLDANAALEEGVAAAWLAAIDRLGDTVEFLEQPLPATAAGMQGMLRLAARHRTPLALDESVAGLPALEQASGSGWPGLFVVKPALAGPPAEVLAWCRRHRGRVVVSSVFETVVGYEAVLRVAAEVHRDTPGGRAAGVDTVRSFPAGDALRPRHRPAPQLAPEPAPGCVLLSVWRALDPSA